MRMSEQVVREQFHATDASGRCQRCGRRMEEHEGGDYWCPQVADAVKRQRLENLRVHLRVRGEYGV